MLKIIFLLFPLLVFSQTKIIFTYVDYEHDEVRAAICNEDGSNRYDLGFNKTYLPVWFQDNILFNSDTFIWKCDTTGENLTKMNEGYRVSVSNDKKKYAFYNLQGIAVANDSGKIIKQMMVDAWEEVGITWSKEDSMISYYNLEKEKCNLFNLNNDSIIIFGDSIYHPLWNKNHNKILYNKKTSENKYNILVSDSFGENEKIINKPGEMAVVPIWSNKGDKIAYLVIKDEPPDEINTDMLRSNLVIYNLETKQTSVLAEDAGFTDRAFPQMSFDAADENIFFTGISEMGTGVIVKINLNSLERKTITQNLNIDERFPLAHSFPETASD